MMRLSRRNVIVAFGAAGAAFGLGYAVRRLTRGGERYGAVDWPAVFQAKEGGGTAEVTVLTGPGTADGRELEIGSIVPSGARVRMEPQAKAVLELPDRTVMELRGEAELELHIDRLSGGFYRLALGAVLSVVPRRNLYLAMGPTAVVGVKGTVFYREVFPADPEPGMTMDGLLEIPERINDYFCTCHGEVDFLHGMDTPVPFRTDRAQHHSSWFLRGNGETTLIEAPMMNHFDDEIDRLIDLQAEPRHDKSWLELDAASRPQS